MLTKKELIDFETLLAKKWEEGKIKVPVHFSGGNEDDLLNVFQRITEGDYVFSTHRNHYHALLHSVPKAKLLKNILKQDVESGLAGSMCTIDYSRHVFSSAIVGGVCAIAVGTALAIKKDKAPKFVWCFIGDGAVDTGHFYEALRYAEGHSLPIMFVVEDNDRSTCTSKVERWGQMDNGIVQHIKESRHVLWYSYKPTYPHVGTGAYVQF